MVAPWYENLGKRLVKAPKLYVADSGLLHSLLEIDRVAALERHPKIGASLEGFAIAQLEKRLRARRGESYFWATHEGAELDLLIVRGRRRLGFEIKRTTAPEITKSMRIALADLRLDRLDGAGRFQSELKPFRTSYSAYPLCFDPTASVSRFGAKTMARAGDCSPHRCGELQKNKDRRDPAGPCCLLLLHQTSYGARDVVPPGHSVVRSHVNVACASA